MKGAVFERQVCCTQGVRVRQILLGVRNAELLFSVTSGDLTIVNNLLKALDCFIKMVGPILNKQRG